MKTLTFSIRINATPSVIWNKLWSDESYRKWTAAFAEGSHAISDWKEGSEILFLGPSGEGMYSIIETLRENEVMIFSHQGELKDGVKTPVSWKDAKEGYYLTEIEDGTDLKVILETDENYAEYFESTFPKALATLKDECED